ncbi:MAG: TonB-dependent receptor plug domain-containing protein, partial [Bacteroidota bacterium]
MRRLFTFLMALGLSASALMAQSVVSGTVTDAASGEAIEGVAVLVRGTTVGMFTDSEGFYRLEIPDGGDVLIFSYVNRKTIEEAIEGRSTINISMVEEISELNEVVVTGYRSFSREKSSVAVSQVAAENITNRPNPSLVQTLSGQVPGLSISTGSGQPGANSVVNIRGRSSINGDTEPLFVIDGAPVDQDNFRSLNPNEIESVTVLKDAAATAIYGNRGANGVIVIETKGGSYNSPLEVTYTFSNIRSTLQDNDYNLMNSREQLTLERDYSDLIGAARGLGAGFSDAQIDSVASMVDTDWPSYFFRTAVGNNHNLQIRRGTSNTSTY